MNEILIEQLVKRKKTTSTMAIKAAAIFVTVIIFACTLIFPPALFIGLVAAFADGYFFKMLDLEYEFVYMKGAFDVDKIMGKERRKRIQSFDMSLLEIVAPINSHLLGAFNDHNCKVINYTSLEPNTKVYAMVIHKGNELLKILFEPNEEILNAMKQEAPRKINLN